jgi:hypothetical protein
MVSIGQTWHNRCEVPGCNKRRPCWSTRCKQHRHVAFGTVTIEPLNGGSGKVIKQFETVEDYIDFRSAHCRFFPGDYDELNCKLLHTGPNYFSVGNGILNFTFKLN